MNSKDAPDGDEVQEELHDLYFTDACQFIDPLSIRDVKPELREVWLTFQDTVQLIRALAYVPQSVVAASVRHMLPYSQAVFQVLKKPVMDDAEITPNAHHVANAYRELVYRGQFWVGRTLLRDVCCHETLLYNKVNNVNVGLVRPGFQALLGAQVMWSWTALDTLTTDLWVAAVNHQPKVLNSLQKKKLTIKALLDCTDHNLTGRLGELLRTRIRFENFTVTKSIFKQTFGFEKAMYEPLYAPDIAIACIVRNNLIHHAGRATQRFISDAKKFGQEPWNKVLPGHTLPLDGRNVVKITNSVINCCNDLIRAFDDWLPEPDPTPPPPTP